MTSDVTVWSQLIKKQLTELETLSYDRDSDSASDEKIIWAWESGHEIVYEVVLRCLAYTLKLVIHMHWKNTSWLEKVENFFSNLKLDCIHLLYHTLQVAASLGSSDEKLSRHIDFLISATYN